MEHVPYSQVFRIAKIKTPEIKYSHKKFKSHKKY